MPSLIYSIVLEPAEEGGYTVTVPALPAVVTEGDTYEEAVEMAREAIGLYLQFLADEDRPIPTEEPPRSRTTVHLQNELPAAS